MRWSDDPDDDPNVDYWFLHLFLSDFSSKASPRPKPGPSKRSSSPKLQTSGNSSTTEPPKQIQQGKANPDSKIEDWWAQFETSVWDQVR